MIKLLGTTSIFVGLAFGTAGVAVAQAHFPPLIPPGPHYVMPQDDFGQPLYEGRSIYRMEEPSAFFNDSDEKGYPSGLSQNPQSPN